MATEQAMMDTIDRLQRENASLAVSLSKANQSIEALGKSNVALQKQVFALTEKNDNLMNLRSVVRTPVEQTQRRLRKILRQAQRALSELEGQG